MRAVCKMREYLKSSFPIGVKICQHRDMQEKYWKQDFSNMETCGINTVRVHAFWSAIEPREGHFYFEQYDRIVEAAAAHGIKTVFTLYMVSAPEWVFDKHPDSRFTSANGTKWDSNHFPDNSHGGWPGLCYDSDPFRATAENFVRVFVSHFKGNNNIHAIDIWHEPDEEPAQQYAQNDWRELLYCYCPHTVEKYRQWLMGKYGSLDALNAAWTRHYERWEQVQPVKNYGIYTDWLDWKHFRMDRITDQVAWLNSLVKKYDPKRATTVHCGIYEIRHPIASSNDHFSLAKTTDMFACSMYDTIHPEVSGFTCDLMRSASGNDTYWIGETETGSGPMFVFLGEHPEDYFAFSRPADPEEINKLVWGAIARGAKGIMYWGWRPDISSMETVSLGFVERDGELTDRTDMLKKQTSIIKRYEKDLLAARAPQSKIAIYYNTDSIIQEGIVSLANSGNCIASIKKRYFKDTLSLIGCYKLCMQNAIQPDFICKEDLESGGLDRYELLILPYSVNITSAAAAEIAKFAAAGGKVLSDGMCGFFTDDGWGSEVCPPHELQSVFGIKVRSNYDLITYCGIGDAYQQYNNVGRFFRERIVPAEGTEVIAEFADGRPAMTRRGGAVYIGTAIFAAVFCEQGGDTNALFNAALNALDFKRESQIEGATDGIVELRHQICDECEFVFVINHSASTETVKIRTPVAYVGSLEEISGRETNARVEDGVLKIKVEMTPSEVLVFRIGKGL